MEEAQPQNSYIQQRGEAIEAIERTIGELGSIFGQLASMVSEQREQIERIDANTEYVIFGVLLIEVTLLTLALQRCCGQRPRRTKGTAKVLEPRIKQSLVNSQDVWSANDLLLVSLRFNAG